MLWRRIWAVNLHIISFHARYTSAFVVCGSHVRYVHQQLLVRIALQLRLLVQSLTPGLLHHFRATTRIAFVQRINCAEVDLLVYVVLQCGREIVGVVVGSALGVVVPVMLVFVMAVRHGWYVVWCLRWRPAENGGIHMLLLVVFGRSSKTISESESRPRGMIDHQGPLRHTSCCPRFNCSLHQATFPEWKEQILYLNQAWEQSHILSL